jgi:hypothetical protein
MSDDYTKREITAVVCSLLIITALTIWGTIYFLSVVVIGVTTLLPGPGALSPSRQFSRSNGASQPGG